MKQSIINAVLLLLLITVALWRGPVVQAQNGTPSGTILWSGPSTGCKATVAGQIGICAVAATGGSQIWISADGGAYAQFGGTTGLLLQNIAGQLTPAQLPATVNSSVTINGFALTSGGVATGSAVQTAIH